MRKTQCREQAEGGKGGEKSGPEEWAKELSERSEELGRSATGKSTEKRGRSARKSRAKTGQKTRERSGAHGRENGRSDELGRAGSSASQCEVRREE